MTVVLGDQSSHAPKNFAEVLLACPPNQAGLFYFLFNFDCILLSQAFQFPLNLGKLPNIVVSCF